MVKKDFITSIVLLAFSLSIVVSSYTMPRLERRGIDPFSAPGVVPGMIGCILLILALILLVRSVRRGGYLLFSAAAQESGGHRGAAWRVILTLAISLIYAVGLLGRIDYTGALALKDIMADARAAQLAVEFAGVPPQATRILLKVLGPDAIDPNGDSVR